MSTTRNWDQEIADLDKQRKEKKKQKAFACDHTSKSPCVMLNEFNDYPVQNRSWYTETTMIHPDCGTLFEARAFTPEEVHMIYFNALSIIHQIKYLTSANTTMDKQKLDELNSMLAAQTNIMATLEPFYNEMTKNLAKQDKGNNNKNRRQKIGRIGVSASAYNN